MPLAVMAELDQDWRPWQHYHRRKPVRDRFAACVATHFPAVQAGKLIAMFADRAGSKPYRSMS